MILNSIRLALLLASATLCSVSTAQTSSSGSISNFSFELIDLDLTDGINSSISLTFQSYVSSSIATIAGNGFDSFTGDQSLSLTTLGSNNSGRGAVTSASITGWDLFADGYTLGAGEYYSQAWLGSKFTLSANTQLIVRGHANASALGDLNYPESTSGYLSVQITDAQGTAPYTQLSFYSTGAFSYNATPRLIDEDFVLAFTNDGPASLNGSLQLAVGAAGAVSPVPEPATYGMLLGGITLLGAVSYRRGRAAART